MLKLVLLGLLSLALIQGSDANEGAANADWPHTPSHFTADISSVSSFNEFQDCSGWKHENAIGVKNMYLSFDRTADGKKELSFAIGHLNYTNPPFELGVEFEETLLGGKSKSIVVHSPPESRYRFVLTQKLEGTFIEHVYVGNRHFMHVESKCCKDNATPNCIHITVSFEPVK